MRLPHHASALCLAAGFLALAASTDAAAKLRPISGKLSRGGYTVIAMSPGGKITAAVARAGKFEVRPRATAVTLQLRAPNGLYAGPVVVASQQRGGQVIEGIRAGAKLGTINVNAGKGYAKVANRLAGRWVDTSRWARARKGVPIGSGRNDGFVRSKPPTHPPAGDLDADGIPDSLDVDRNGNLILNQYDRTKINGAGRTDASNTAIDIVPLSPPGVFLAVLTGLTTGGGSNAVNADGGSTDAQIAAADQASGSLGVMWSGIDPGSGELDCGTLVYCSAGGTGKLQSTDTTTPADAPAYPSCCDGDRDGLGALLNTQKCGIGDNQGEGCMGLLPGATPDQLRAGDVLIARGTQNGTPVEYAASVGFVYASFPVVASYDDGQGDSATLSYPRPPDPRCGFNPCALPVRAGPNGQVVLKLTFWRPQRLRIEGEPGSGKWMDVGNLVYGTALAPSGAASGPSKHCPESSYSNVDPNLTPVRNEPRLKKFGGFRFADSRGDRPASPANTFTYTLSLTDCLASSGQSMSTTAPTGLAIWGFVLPPWGGLVFTQSRVQFQLTP